jgi:hypothetical protein
MGNELSATEFRYRLPEGAEAAQLVINGLDGRTLETFAIGDSAGSIVWKMANVKNGVYLFSLVVDGKRLETQRLVIAK